MKKIIFGLTGSIASGKSTVSKMFKNMTIPVFDADETVHRLMRDHRKMKDLFQRKIPDCFTDDEIDRKKLSQKVNEGTLDVKQLESMIYPFLEQELQLFFERHSYEPIIVLDIPLLFEAKWDRFCNESIVMTADPLILQKRALSRPGMTIEKYNTLKLRQMSEEEKIKRATYVINSGHTIEEVRLEVEQIVQNARNRLGYGNNGV